MCPICDEVFDYNRELIEHKLKEHSDKSWECNNCGKGRVPQKYTEICQVDVNIVVFFFSLLPEEWLPETSEDCQVQEAIRLHLLRQQIRPQFPPEQTREEDGSVPQQQMPHMPRRGIQNVERTQNACLQVTTNLCDPKCVMNYDGTPYNVKFEPLEM